VSALVVLAGLWVLLGAVWLAIWPFFDRERPPVSVALLELQELETEKGRLIAEIHDLQLDFETGKLAEEDYRALEARLKTRAVDVIREMEARAGARPLAG
jgi:hypothetical protein